ncbi:hypothetical protein V6O07_14950, partial [Arthrospira platensis SPKY2]
GDGNDCVSVELGGGDNSRSVYIEYNDHYSQIGMYCLGNAALTVPDFFPLEQAEFCKSFFPELRGSGFGLPGGNSPLLDPTTQNALNNINESELKVPKELLAVILEIE